MLKKLKNLWQTIVLLFHIAQLLWQGKRLYVKGCYQQAIQVTKEALALSQQSQSFDNVHHLEALCRSILKYTALQSLVNLCSEQGDYEGAEGFCGQAIDLVQRWWGDSLFLARLWNSLAIIYHTQGRYSEAERFFDSALNLAQRVDYFVNYKTEVLNNLAVLYLDQNRNSDAERILLQLLESPQRRSLNKFTRVQIKADILNNLASIYKNKGNYTEAESCYKQSLGLLQSLFRNEHDSCSPDCCLPGFTLRFSRALQRGRTLIVADG